MTAAAFIHGEMGGEVEPYLRLVVYGGAVTQGSKSAFPVRRGDRMGVAVTEGKKSDALKIWRWAIADEARAWLKANGAPAPIEEPCILGITFYVQRPKSAPKRKLFPTARPDLLKMIRAAEDAMTKILYRDDSFIIGYDRPRKLFAVDSPPRVEITLRLATESDL